jgi:hypothetical protein
MVTKKRLLQHLKNDIYCRIRVSKVYDVGVIAIKDIHPNVHKILKIFFGEKKVKNYLQIIINIMMILKNR